MFLRTNFRNGPVPGKFIRLILPIVCLCVMVAGCSATERTVGDPTAEQPQEPEAGVLETAVQPNALPDQAGPAQKAVGRKPEDWPGFLGPRGDGTSAEGIDLSLWKPAPPIRWSIPIGVSYGAPSVVNNQVYQFDRYGDSERLTVYDATTGKESWRWEYEVQYSDTFGYNNGPRCSPIIDGDSVYLYGVAGQLSCVSIESKQAIWSKNLNELYGVVPNFFGVASNPFVYGDLLIVMVGGSPVESRGLSTMRLSEVKPDNSAIVAFDKKTGKEKYRVGDALASYSSPIVRKIDGRDMGLAFLRDGLLAFDPAGGKRLSWFTWRASMLESVNAAVPVVDGDRILISEAYEIGSAMLKYAPTELEVIWKDDKPIRSQNNFRAHWSTPVLVDGFLYGGNGRNQPDCDFRCIRFDTGEVQWKFWRRERTSLCYVDGYLVVLGELGTLRVIEPNPKEPIVVAECNLGEMQVPGAATDAGRESILARPPCWAAPVISNGNLYIRSRERLTCFQIGKG